MQFVEALRQSGRPLTILAPLAGITHKGMRLLVEDYGSCDYFFNEMISVDSFGAGSQYERYYLDTGPDPERCVLQIIGSDHDKMVRGASIINNLPCAGLDINMGCSAPALTRKGSGVSWQERPAEALEMVAAVRAALPDRGLSVKLRMPDSNFEPFAAFCMQLESVGVEAVTFHPRTQSDPWARPAKRRLFPELAARLTIPVVCNGDIAGSSDIDQLEQLYREAGLGSPAGYMIGRAAISRPWMFDTLARGPRERDRTACARAFHQHLEGSQPRDFWLSRAKRFHAYFCQSLAFGNRLAGRIQSAGSYNEILPMYLSYFEDADNERMEFS